MIEILIWIAIMILTVALVTFVLSRLPKSVFFLAIILCISGVSFPLFQSQFSHTDGAFAYLKFLSTGLACLIVGWYRFAGSQPNWPRIALYIIFIVNILEAVAFEILDVVSGGPERSMGGNLLNAVAGVILILTLTGPGSIQRNAGRVEYDLGKIWIAAYILWNFVFVLGTNPPERPTGEYAGFAVIHLSVAAILMGSGGRLFAEMRTYSLFLLMGMILVLPAPPFLYRTANWHSFILADGLAIASLALAAILLIVHLTGFRSKSKQSSSTEGNMKVSNSQNSLIQWIYHRVVAHGHR